MAIVSEKAVINESVLDVVGKSFKFDHSKGITEWLKNNSNKFENLYKTFRLKNRYSFTSNNIRLDLTIVRSSKKNFHGKPIWSKNIIESSLLENTYHYEVEMECVGNYNDIPNKKIVTDIFGNYLILIMILDNINYVLSNTQ